MKEPDFSKVSVVMASRNEEGAIGKVIADIKKATKNMAEIVVVDGSTDRTPEIAENLGAKVIRQKPQGYGVAVKAALLAATRDIIVTVDCDATYPTERIPDMVSLLNQGYDVVSGARMASSGSMPALNIFGNKFFARLTSLLYGAKVSDVTTGMRAYRREIIQKIEWTENVGLSAELLFKPIICGYRVTEMQIEYYPRIGQTKLNPLIGGLGILKSILKYRLMRVKRSQIIQK